MGDAARRSAGRRAGRAGIALAALLAVAGLVIVLATHRDVVSANPNSAILASVPPLTRGGTATVAVSGLPSDVRGTDAFGTDLPDPASETGAPWPAAPADPTAAVDAAIAQAAADGIRVAVTVVDRPSGAVLVARDADIPFPSLSLLKVMIAADVLTNGWPVESASTEPPPFSTDPMPSDPAADESTDETTDETDDPLPVLDDPAQIGALLTRMIATSDDEIASDLYDAAGGDELVDRVVQRYGLTGTTPTPDGTYWGNVQITAADMATLLAQVLADPRTATVIGDAMRATTATAADGLDQRFGLRLVPGAGSKQGWGCCLSGELGLHSIGFTDDRIVVVLSAADPDDESLGEQDGLALADDPGAQAGFAAVDAVVRAALGGPAG